MSNAGSTFGNRVQLLVLVDATDTLARYCVLSIDTTLFAATALAPGWNGFGSTRHPHIELIDGAGAEREPLGTWLDRKQRCGTGVLTAA